MTELILLLIIAFCAGAFTFGAYEYLADKFLSKRCQVFMLEDEKGFIGYEVISKDGKVSKFIGDQKLIEPFLSEYLADKIVKR